MAKQPIYFNLNDDNTSIDDLKNQLETTFKMMDDKEADKIIKQALGKFGREVKKVAANNAKSIKTERGKTPIGKNINKLLKASVKRNKSDNTQYWSRVKANNKKASIDFAPNGSKKLIALSSRNIHWWEGGTSTGIKANNFMKNAYDSTKNKGVTVMKTMLDEYVQKRIEKLNKSN